VRRLWVLVLVAGCGRWSFDSRDDAARSDDDGAMTTIDSRPFDAAADGVAATTCGATSTRECDGFESGAFDPMWTLDTSRGTITIDSTRAYRGASSVHVRIDPITSSVTNPRAVLLGPGGLGTTITGIIYFRIWMYVASPVSANPYNQLINAANQSGQGISMGTRGGLVTNNDYTDGGYAESATTFPLDRWTCLQFQMPSNVSGTTRVFIDGTELTDVALTKATTQPPPDHVYLGLEWVGTLSSQPAVDAWMDEIVIDTQPTTCAQ
jgi:hypothetical protein